MPQEYKSKIQAEKKLSQAKYVLKDMQKFRGKVFVNNGIDKETGASPLQVCVSSFLAHSRSVLQYTYKECKQNNSVNSYEQEIINHPIISVFRDLRNTDTHEMVIGTYTIISCESTFGSKNVGQESEPKEASVSNTITRPVAISDELINELRESGKYELADAAESGKPLYETVKHEGEENLFILCEKYIYHLESFLSELVRKGVVS